MLLCSLHQLPIQPWLLSYTSYDLLLIPCTEHPPFPPKVRHRAVPHSSSTPAGLSECSVREQRAQSSGISAGHLCRCSAAGLHKIAQQLTRSGACCANTYNCRCLLSLSFNVLNLEQHLYWPLAEKSSLLGEYLDLLWPPNHIPDRYRAVIPWEVFPLLQSTGVLALPQPWEMLNRDISEEQAV